MEKILIIGAGGQIGVELTLALREKYGRDAILATDIREPHPLLAHSGPYQILDVMNAVDVEKLVKNNGITQIYLMAAILSATGEKNPEWAWNINMNSLLSLLEISVRNKVKKLFWPSSIAVFGPTTPKKETPNHTIAEPTTVYGISKYAGELWCQYYRDRFGLDVRGIRYPGIISWKSAPGGGTTDYAIDIYIEALKNKKYTCFLKEDAYLPMMYMDDAVRATIEIMEADQENLKNGMAYNIASMTFAPKEVAESIRKYIPEFTINYAPDQRQQYAASWPQSIDDSEARSDWSWKPAFDLDAMTKTMLHNLSKKVI